MSNLIVLVGLPASGKSTVAQELARKYNAIVLSSDQLRIELCGDVDDQEHNEAVFKELHKRLMNCLKQDQSVIYDACNISYKRRKTFLEEVNKFSCKKICHLLAVPYEECLERNEQRERKIPEYVIKRMYLNFYIPEYYEGWDEIHISYCYNRNNFALDQLKNRLKISQDNSHHTLNIYEHCVKCRDIIKERTNSDTLITAALYHDIGKVFTKQFKNAKGESTDEAHFYQHHLVSAYETMFYLNRQDKSDDFILGVCNLIQWHMRPFDIDSDKARDKFVRLIGQKFYDNLMLLHQADVEAH